MKKIRPPGYFGPRPKKVWIAGDYLRKWFDSIGEHRFTREMRRLDKGVHGTTRLRKELKAKRHGTAGAAQAARKTIEGIWEGIVTTLRKYRTASKKGV